MVQWVKRTCEYEEDSPVTPQKERDREAGDGVSLEGYAVQFWHSNCCYSHDWPYFREAVHPYDYSGDWDLEKEWKRRSILRSR